MKKSLILTLFVGLILLFGCKEDEGEIKSTSSCTDNNSDVILYIAGSTALSGNLGGRSGADSICNNSSNKPGGYCNVRALITVNASDRIADMPVKYGVETNLPIEFTDGTLFADNWTDAMAGSIYVATGTMPNYPAITNFLYWTGSGSGGLLNTNRCSDFTDGTSDVNGAVGDKINTTGLWLGSGYSSCDTGVSDVNYGRSILCVAF